MNYKTKNTTYSTILVTGSAGFIGFHTSLELLKKGFSVIGIDNFNDYYSPELKEKRNKILNSYKSFKLYRGDICDKELIFTVLNKEKPDKICHLAAQAGVRYSIEKPNAYLDSNVIGFLNILEGMAKIGTKHIVYASSSSVYGGNKKIPFSESDSVCKPLSMYATTKRMNELMAYNYHQLYGINSTGLRFFTVYGEFGRPDMALYIFTKNILDGTPIKVFNYGRMKRNFTYINDIVNGVCLSLENEFDYQIFNLGNNKTVELSYFINKIENLLNKKAIREFLPIQEGDVPETLADISKAETMLGFQAKTDIDLGVKRFINWYLEYNNTK